MKTLRSLVKVIHTNFFDEEPWDAYHYSKIGITDTRMLEVIPLEDGAGAVMKIGLNSGNNYIFQLDIIRDNIPSTSALMFAIRDDNMNILESQEVNENGLVYQQFTAPFSGSYFVTVTQNTVVNPASFYLDNYYVYALPASGQDFVSLYLPDVLAYNDYYPFGMQVPRRFDSLEDYRYGFQGQEKDNEIKGEGNSLNYTFRMHDPRVGRFFAVDPLEKAFHWNSPYAFSENRVMDAFELEGAESVLIHGTLTPWQDSYELWDYTEDGKNYLIRDFATSITQNSHHVDGSWSGTGGLESARMTGADEIAAQIIKYRKDNNLIKEPIFVLGQSHGGNVGIEVINILDKHYQELGDKVYRPKMYLITLNTPNVAGTSLNNDNLVEHYNIYASDDIMSRIGQGLEHSLLYGQKFSNADLNIEYQDQTEGSLDGSWNHMGHWTENVEEWKPKFEAAFQELEKQRKAFIEKIKRDYKKNKDKDVNDARKTKVDNTKVANPIK